MISPPPGTIVEFRFKTWIVTAIWPPPELHYAQLVELRCNCERPKCQDTARAYVSELTIPRELEEGEIPF